MLVVVDQFLTLVECYALLDQTAEGVARTLASEFIGRCVCPIELHSDQGRNLESWMFKEVCELSNSVKMGPYHTAQARMVRWNV